MCLTVCSRGSSGTEFSTTDHTASDSVLLYYTTGSTRSTNSTNSSCSTTKSIGECAAVSVLYDRNVEGPILSSKIKVLLAFKPSKQSYFHKLSWLERFWRQHKFGVLDEMLSYSRNYLKCFYEAWNTESVRDEVGIMKQRSFQQTLSFMTSQGKSFLVSYVSHY